MTPPLGRRDFLRTIAAVSAAVAAGAVPAADEPEGGAGEDAPRSPAGDASQKCS